MPSVKKCHYSWSLGQSIIMEYRTPLCTTMFWLSLQASHTCGLAITQSSVRVSVTELPWLGHISCVTRASQCEWTGVSSHRQTFWSASRTFSTIFRWSKNLSGYICRMEIDEAYRKVQKSNLTRVEQIKELHEEIEELKKNNEVGRIARWDHKMCWLLQKIIGGHCHSEWHTDWVPNQPIIQIP